MSNFQRRRDNWGKYPEPFKFNILVQDFSEIASHTDWKYNFTTPRPMGSFYTNSIGSALGNYSPKVNCRFHSRGGNR